MVQAATESVGVMPHEPHASAVFFVVVALLLAASALLSHASQRLRLPVGLVFLAIGIVAGSEGLGHIAFDDFGFAFRAGSAALALILFDGGLNTPVDHAAAFARAGRSAGDGRRGRLDVHRGRGRARAGPSLERVVPARRDRLVHGRRGGVRRAARQRDPAQAPRRRHARGGVGDQRSRRGDPHDGAHEPTAEQRRAEPRGWWRSGCCARSRSAPRAASRSVRVRAGSSRASGFRRADSIR